MTESEALQNQLANTFAGAAVARLGERLGDLTQTVQQLLLTEVSELNGDALLQELLHDTVESNIETVFSAIRHGIPTDRIDPPAAALEHARRLAQREVTVDALTRGYRLGHKALLRALLEEVRGQGLDAQLSLDVYGQIAEVTFGYIDAMSQQVVAMYQHERDTWLQNRSRLRTLRVRELLNSDEVDVEALTEELRYPLHRTHLAVTMWHSERLDGNELVSLEHDLQRIGRIAGASESPLFVPEDGLTASGWIPLESVTTAEAVFAIRAQPGANGIHLTIGNAQPGVEGFRRSHRQAHDARAVALAMGRQAPGIIAASDPGLAIAAMLGADIEGARHWVHDVLGPLAAHTENDEVLRQTLQTFLGAGSSFKAAAETLHLHHNSVKYRVRRASERRGRPLGDDRLDVEIALLLCQWYGIAVLK